MDFQVEDRVEVINYGKLQWISKAGWAELYLRSTVKVIKPNFLIEETEDFYGIDMCPELVGLETTIVEISRAGISHKGEMETKYKLAGFRNWWVYKDQLKLL